MTQVLLGRALFSWLPPIVAAQVMSRIFPAFSNYAGQAELTVHVITGSSYVGNLNDFHVRQVAFLGYYEWRIAAIARFVCKPGDSILEIGANVGTETIIFSDIVGSSGRVIAFEPLPANIEAIRMALSKAKSQNVHIVPKALSSHSGQVTFVAPVSQFGSGTGHIAIQSIDTMQTTIEVESGTLDDHTSTIERVSLVHIDAEGSEVAILEGGSNYLLNAQPFITIEANPKALQRMGADIDKFYNCVLKLGYTPFRIAPLGLQPITSDKLPIKTQNWLCIPNSQLHLSREISRKIGLAGTLPVIFGLNPLSGK